MSIWDRFRGKPPNPPEPPNSPKPPEPLESPNPPERAAPPTDGTDGTIESFNIADAVGTIRLVTGDSVRFGRTSCSFEPAVGMGVRVLATAVGPLSRVRATRVERLAAGDGHERLLDERDRAAGHSAPGYSSGGTGIQSATLGVTTRHPVPDRSALRTFWEKAALSSIAKLDFVPGPIAVTEHHQFEVRFGAGPLDTVLDTRLRPGVSSLGNGFIGFWDGHKSARDPKPGASNEWGFGPKGSARSLLEIVAKLVHCRGEITGVVIGTTGILWPQPGRTMIWNTAPAPEEARVLWHSPEQWLDFVGDIRSPDNIPLEAFVEVARSTVGQGVRYRSLGMRALALPEIVLYGPLAADDDVRHQLCTSVVWAACRMLAWEDAFRDAPPDVSLPVGNTVKVRVGASLVSFRVVDETDSIRGRTRQIADVTLIGP